jgi:hypothetical protein
MAFYFVCRFGAVRAMALVIPFLVTSACDKGNGTGSPADGGGGPSACGDQTCGSGQICVHPTCCQGGGVTCHPLPDSGTCPANTDPVTCPVEAKPGCMDRPCTKPDPFCMDLPGSCAGSPTCSCLSGPCSPNQCTFFDSQKRSLECGCP